MKAEKHFIKRKYLAKIIITCTAFMLVPFIIFSYTIIFRSYHELVNTNEEYYKKTTNSFAKYFQAQMTEIQMSALKVGEDGKKIDSPLRLSALQSNSYYFRECVDLLLQYSVTSKYPMGIYYYDTGYLFTKDTNYTKESFIKRYLGIEDEEEILGLQDFFTYDSGKSFKLFSTFSSPSTSNLLLVGVTIRIGNTQDKALVFYMLDSSSIDTSLFSSQSSSGTQYYIIDSNSDSLLFTTASQSESLTSEKIRTLLTDYQNNVTYYKNDDMRYNIYFVHDSAFNRDYLSLMPFDAVEDNVYQFYITMQKLALVAIIWFLSLLCIMVYINYRPIQKIMRKFNKNTSCDEFITISSTFDEISNEMSEQNLLIMDFLLGNILCGKPIPVDERNKLGISLHHGNFSVCTIEGLVFNTELRTRLTHEIEEKFNITAYITDIFGLNRIVIILLLRNEETSEIISCINSNLSAHFSKPYDIKEGIVVKSINDIQKSYISCLKADNATGSFDASQESYKQAANSIELENKKSYKTINILKDKVIEFVQQNFTDPTISQISVADHFGISIYTLSRLFKNHIGFGFSEYITGKRLDYAKNLLLTTDKTVAEISYDIGISNISYFSRLFKSNIGITPLNFRSNMGNITR